MPSIDKPFFFHAEYRAAFLASMAGRLKDVISDEAGNMLKEKGLSTPATDVSFILYLSEHNNATIADIAKAQGFSHQRVASRIAQLEKRALLVRQIDEQDQRCKVVTLTEKGRQEASELAVIYHNAAKAIEQVFDEIGDDLMDKLQVAISAFSRESLPARIARIQNATPN